MCLVLTNPVEILAVQLVKQGIEAGGFCTRHPSNYYLLLSNPYIEIPTGLYKCAARKNYRSKSAEINVAVATKSLLRRRKRSGVYFAKK